MYLQQMSRGGREEKIDPLIAGLVGGCYIFGNDSAVVQQVRWSPITRFIPPSPLSLTLKLLAGEILIADEFVCVCEGYARVGKTGN